MWNSLPFCGASNSICFATVDKPAVSLEPGGTRGPKVYNERLVSASQVRMALMHSGAKFEVETDTNPSHSREKLPNIDF